MSVSMKVTGMEEVLKNMDKASAEMVKILSTELLKGALMVEKDAKKLCRVKTNRLRSSITFEAPKIINGNLIAKVGTDVEYGPYVEFGTQRSREYPYLRPALRDNQEQIRNNITKAVKNYTGKKTI